VLTRDRLDEIVPIGNAAMDDRTFIEWDKDDIDALRHHEGRCAGARHAHLHPQGVRSDADHGGMRSQLATVPREDPAVYDMLCAGDSIGVFQVESRAQMNMLPRLRAKVLRSRHRGGDRAARPDPGRHGASLSAPPERQGESGISLAVARARAARRTGTCWARRNGVPLFQEQAMKLAIVAAKFTPEEANGLRRAMATFRNGHDPHVRRQDDRQHGRARL
jgi:error-prone DNA polymerase